MDKIKSFFIKSKFSRKAVGVVTVLLLTALTTIAVIAFQTTFTDVTDNQITAKKLNASIEEVVDDTYKEEIIITADEDNSGDLYVRATLVVNWETLDDSAVVVAPLPDLSPYINTDDWTPTEVVVSEHSQHTNTYYVYNSPLAPGESTENLLKEPIELISDDGKKLEITVLMQAGDKEYFEGSIMK